MVACPSSLPCYLLSVAVVVSLERHVPALLQRDEINGATMLLPQPCRQERHIANVQNSWAVNNAQALCVQEDTDT